VSAAHHHDRGGRGQRFDKHLDGAPTHARIARRQIGEIVADDARLPVADGALPLADDQRFHLAAAHRAHDRPVRPDEHLTARLARHRSMRPDDNRQRCRLPVALGGQGRLENRAVFFHAVASFVCSLSARHTFSGSSGASRIRTPTAS